MSLSITIQQLLDKCTSDWSRRTVKAGDFLYAPGDVDTHVYLIEKGLIKIGSLGDWGQRILYDMLQPGELLGDLDYLDDTTFFEYAQAATSASLFAINRGAFRYAVSHTPSLANWFSEMVVRRWHRTEVRLLHRNGLSVEERIRHLQKQYSALISDASNQPQHPFSQLSYQDIGDLVGATRQTVSRKIRIPLKLSAGYVMEQ